MSLRRVLLLLLVIAAPPAVVAILMLSAFAAIVGIYLKTGIGVDLELVAAASIVLLGIGYGGATWWACGCWPADGQRISVAKRLSITAIAGLLGVALGFAAFIIAANIGVDTSFH